MFINSFCSKMVRDVLEHFLSNAAVMTDIHGRRASIRAHRGVDLVADSGLDVSHSQAYNLASLNLMMFPMWRDQTASQLRQSDDSKQGAIPEARCSNRSDS